MVRTQRKLETIITDLKSQFVEFERLKSQNKKIKQFRFLRLTLLYNLLIKNNFEEKLNFLHPLNKSKSQGLSGFKKSLISITPLEMLQYHEVSSIVIRGDDILYEMRGSIAGESTVTGTQKLKLFDLIKKEIRDVREANEKIYTFKFLQPEEVSESLVSSLEVYKYHLLKILEIKNFRDILVENSLFQMKTLTFTRDAFFCFITLLDSFLERYIQALFFFARTYAAAVNYFREEKML
jgi:hypothetical protein